MPQLTIQLRFDPETGRRDVVVKLDSDADALPTEHESLHRALVEKLIRGGVLKPGEAGRLVVEREGEGAVASPASTPAEEGRRAASAGQ